MIRCNMNILIRGHVHPLGVVRLPLSLHLDPVQQVSICFPCTFFVHKIDLQHGIASKFEINILKKIDKFMMKTFYVHSLENMSLLDDTFSRFVSLDSV